MSSALAVDAALIGSDGASRNLQGRREGPFEPKKRLAARAEQQGIGEMKCRLTRSAPL